MFPEGFPEKIVPTSPFGIFSERNKCLSAQGLGGKSSMHLCHMFCEKKHNCLTQVYSIQPVCTDLVRATATHANPDEILLYYCYPPDPRQVYQLSSVLNHTPGMICLQLGSSRIYWRSLFFIFSSSAKTCNARVHSPFSGIPGKITQWIEEI